MAVVNSLHGPAPAANGSPARAVLVTGASGTIGRAVALAFAREGARVGVHYCRNRTAGRETADLLRSFASEVCLFQADLRQEDEVRAMFCAVGERFGRLDVLVNSAGAVADRALIHMAEDEFRGVVGADLLGPIHSLRAAAALMGPGGAIIQVGSIVGSRGARGQCNYAAAKAGLAALTRSAARALGPRRITVNAVLPGFQRSRLSEAGGRLVFEAARRESVLECTTCLDEVARFIVFLTKLRTVSGQVFNLDSRVVSG